MKYPPQADTVEAVLLDYVERYGLTERARKYFLSLGQDDAIHGSRPEARRPQND